VLAIVPSSAAYRGLKASLYCLRIFLASFTFNNEKIQIGVKLKKLLTKFCEVTSQIRQHSTTLKLFCSESIGHSDQVSESAVNLEMADASYIVVRY